jgi:hypothetical protein
MKFAKAVAILIVVFNGIPVPLAQTTEFYP